MLKTRAIVLKKVKYSESDLIVQLLIPEGGALSLMARGAQKSRKRFGGGVLEPCHHIEIQYQKSNRVDGLGILSEAHVIEDFQGLRTDYDRIELALWILDAVGKVSQEGDTQSAALFNLLGHGLKNLASVPDIKKFQVHFSLRFLHQQGVLDLEPWMKPWLAIPLASAATTELPDFQDRQAYWAREQVEKYISQAAV